MKKLLTLCFISIVMLGGCTKKDLTDFHVINDVWSITYFENVDYTVKFKEKSDKSVTLLMTKNHLDDNSRFVLSSNDRIVSVVYGGKAYEETLIPFVYPIGIYEIPLEKDSIEFVIGFSMDFSGFNGYLKTSILGYPSFSTIYYGLSVEFY